MNCLGIPVEYNERVRVISESRGLWPLKKIVVGPGIRSFTPREQQAFLTHEAGHCKLFHLEKRLMRVWLFFRPALMREYLHQQEFQADYFAAECGYARDLISAFQKIQSPGGALHPSTASRIERLLAWLSKA